MNSTHQHSLDPLAVGAVGAVVGLLIGAAQTRDEIAALRREMAVRDAWAHDPSLARAWRTWDQGEAELAARASGLATYPQIIKETLIAAVLAPFLSFAIIVALVLVGVDVGGWFAGLTLGMPATWLVLRLLASKGARDNLTEQELAHLHRHGGHTHTHPHTSRHHHGDRTVHPFGHFHQS